MSAQLPETRELWNHLSPSDSETYFNSIVAQVKSETALNEAKAKFFDALTANIKVGGALLMDEVKKRME